MATNAFEEKLKRIRGNARQLSQRPSDGSTSAAWGGILTDVEALIDELRFNHEQSRLGALYRVSCALGSSLDLGEVLNQVMDAVIGLTNAERGFLVLLEGESGEWELRAARNFTQESLQPKDMEVSRTIINTVIQNGRGLLTTDARNDPRFSGSVSVVYYALRSIMCAPLFSRGKAIGAVYVDNRAQIALFTQEDLELLNTFASQAAVAIENAWLYTRTDQDLARRVAELETLALVDQELNTRLDFDHVIELAHKWITQESKADQVWVLLQPVDVEKKTDEQSLVAFPSDFPDSNDTLIAQALEHSTVQVSLGDGVAPSRLAVPIMHSGKPLGVVVVDRHQPFSSVDVDFLSYLCARAAAAIENARLYQAVQQANQAKTKFVSVVTHELRIPMTSIKGYTDLIRQGAVGPVNDQQLSFLNIVRNNVERMTALVSDLSDISRIETGRLKLECSMISIQESLKEVLNNILPRLDEKQQTLDTDILVDLPEVYADPNRLVQILTNLIGNACKYTKPGGKLGIRAGLQDNMVRVEVSDSGIGISPQDQARLFTQFFRSEDPDVREEQGWGLGLNVTRLLVELMGGRIGVSSIQGAGSTFWFTLPVGAAENGAGENQ